MEKPVDVRSLHPESAPRIQGVSPTPGESLASDLRTLQALANRRGGAWLIKWAMLFRGLQPGDVKLDLEAAERSGDVEYLDYVKQFPLGIDPRD